MEKNIEELCECGKPCTFYNNITEQTFIYTCDRVNIDKRATRCSFRKEVSYGETTSYKEPTIKEKEKYEPPKDYTLEEYLKKFLQSQKLEHLRNIEIKSGIKMDCSLMKYLNKIETLVNCKT